ncbi:MAG TPA: Gp15 family bacteriophage protein [Candidatus Limiplasma sp.]|nr:Gp15 family bacteriophage protein [Candidatus Limiplasma sp.]
MISLSRSPEKVLIRSIVVDGIIYPVDPDFRTVLACVRVYNDPEKPDLEKALYVAQRFFLGNVPPDMGQAFSDFLRDESQEDDGEQLMDFELDAGVIYASFRQQYGINLMADSLHWYEFRALLSGLTEDTPFGQRVHIRSMDINDVPEKARGKLRKLKEALSIAPQMSKREAELRAELDRRLEAGEDPAEIIQSLQGV